MPSRKTWHLFLFFKLKFNGGTLGAAQTRHLLKKVDENFCSGQNGFGYWTKRTITRKPYLFQYPSHFEAVFDGQGRANATSPKRERALFVGV